MLLLKPDFHTREYLRDKTRCIRAIEIAEYRLHPEADIMRKTMTSRPDIRPLVIGATLLREEMRERIAKRLKARLDSGMMEEVENLHKSGASWERLETLGLEYGFVAEYLQGKIASREELYEKLVVAIRRFAKRQETWFRGMERKMKMQGSSIHWLPCVSDIDVRVRAALSLVDEYVVMR